MRCGREPGGANADSLGVCHVATESAADGLNEGKNGGRICWIIAENCTEDESSCPHKKNPSSCFGCEFRYKVMLEEGLLNVCKATGRLLEVQKKEAALPSETET